ncbi:hypothetical protein PanNE5_29430 [Pandoraea sp. NE5]|uniref:ribosome modulation factor n=1 Tax=Pandoraea sp. NE5 TaxID=2904129 RepID=UPI0021C33821|nr:Rmf/CrpP family protein [Pandoraea sp. NE5]BDD93503.1 hypothetical protein PanNE5_29430 [Pandoraea sp. NE5]
MSHSPEMKDTMNMTATTLGKDLLGALVQEIRLLPDVWVKLAEHKQNDVIDRLRTRVDAAVKMAVHLIASQGRVVVVGDLDQITIKDGAKAVVKIGKSVTALHDLAEAQGQAVLLVLSGNHESFTSGMDEVSGEADQRSFDMGREYTDADGDGMDDDIVDAEIKTIEHQPLQEELDAALEAGYSAAQAGEPESACPVQSGALCIAWVKGWKAWHDEQADGADDLYDAAVEHVIATNRATITTLQRHLKIGYNRANRLIERMEVEGIVSAPDETGERTVLRTTEEQEG